MRLLLAALLASLILAACAAIFPPPAPASASQPAAPGLTAGLDLLAQSPPRIVASALARPVAQHLAQPIGRPVARPIDRPSARLDLLAGSRSTWQDGWLLVHLEGTPYQLGYQRGYLTSKLSAQWVRSCLGPSGPARTRLRRIAARFIWPKVPAEYRQEMRGIAAGMRARGNKADVWDVVAANAWADLYVYRSSAARSLTSAAEGTASLSGRSTASSGTVIDSASSPLAAGPTGAGHCSAFIATGSATRDHRIVMGHTTWAGYGDSFTDRVIFDMKPASGHSFRYQGAPAAIWSGEDWYVNDTGLMICETSFEDSPVNPRGVPLFVRIREAVQYASSIDDVVRTLRRHNNGAYPNEWLIGDAKTDEIASLQLGCRASDLKRTSSGFYGSSNWPTGRNWLRETPWDSPSWANGEYDRYMRWRDLRDRWWGRIDAQAGETMLADHRDYYLDRTQASSRTICGHFEAETEVRGDTIPYGSIDGKVITSTMALSGMQMLARWGHPCGAVFQAGRFLRTHPAWARSHDSFTVAGLRAFDRATPQPWTLVSSF